MIYRYKEKLEAGQGRSTFRRIFSRFCTPIFLEEHFLSYSQQLVAQVNQTSLPAYECTRSIVLFYKPEKLAPSESERRRRRGGMTRGREHDEVKERMGKRRPLPRPPCSWRFSGILHHAAPPSKVHLSLSI